MTDKERHALAQAVRDACIRALQQGYENGAISGLCEEGALEAAISALQMLDIEQLLKAAPATPTEVAPGQR